MTPRIAISGLALGAALLAGGLHQRSAGRAGRSLTPPPQERDADRGRELGSLAVPRFVPPAREQDPPGPTASAPELDGAHARRAVDELAATLRSGDDSPSGFDVRARSLARELEGADDTLLAIASDPELEPNQHLAAAELLRHRRPDGATHPDVLPAAALWSSRSLLEAVDQAPLPGTVAARTLAAAGDGGDAARLLGLLSGEDGTAKREAATWGLARAPGAWVVHELVELAVAPADDKAAEAALIVLEARSAAESRAGFLNAEGAARLAALTRDPAVSASLRRRAVRTLIGLDSGVAVPALRATAERADAAGVREAAVEELVALDTREARAQLEAVLFDPAAETDLRRQVAFGLARDPQALAPGVRAELTGTLERTAVDADALSRRRALVALGELGGSETLRILADVARHDPDARVRQAAVVGLGRRGGETVRELLAEVAERDASESVRRIARHAAR